MSVHSHMAWTMADIPDLGGRTAVVIGANGGPGWRPRVRVAAAGATVVLAARSPDKTAAAVDTICAETPSAQLDVVALDLASLDAVRAAVATILERHPAIDVLVNNA